LCGAVLSIVLGIFFVALIATPVVLKRVSARHAAVGVAASCDTVTVRYGFCFQEVANAAGIEFRHHAPSLDPQLAHIMPTVASMGAAVSIVDIDRDGWQDIYVTNSAEGSRNHLYRNRGDGTFQDVAAAMGVADVNQADTGVSMGAVWGDYDNDGYEDLFLYKWGRPELFRNEQGRRFVRVTAHAGLPSWINANTAIWLDYDRDGRLDLFIGGYFAEHVNLWKLETTRIMPESFEYAKNGGRKYLLRNRGDGRFEDVTEQLGITSRRWALAATVADLRGTGYPDLFIANDYGVSELYFNDGGARFREVGKQTGVGFAPKSGMNAAVGDILRAANKMRLQELPTYQCAANGQEGFMDLRQPFVPDAQAAKLVQPGKCAFDHPSIYPEPTAVRSTALGEHRGDPTGAQALAVRFGIIATSAVEALGFTAGAAPLPSDRGNSLDEGNELGHVVRVRAGQDDRERNPLRLRHDMMLTPQLPSIRRIRPRFAPPQTARTEEESTTARDQSRVSASRRLAQSTAWSRCQTPARCQARRYRQHVIPEPQPNSWGSMAQGIPLFKTNKMPVSTLRRAKG
jgi:VCBS repeat protein